MSGQIFQFITSAFETYQDEVAIVFEDDSIHYADLDRRVYELSERIKASIPRETIVAVSCHRSIDTIVNLLSVLAAGITYLPIDFDLPVDRLQKIVSEAGVNYFLPASPTESHSAIGLSVIPEDNADGRQEAVVSDHAYVLFTSGSTGVPKGVCMPHLALSNLVEWQNKNSKSGVGFRTLQFAKLTFDVSFQEIFCTLSTGGTLCLVRPDTLKDPYLILQYIENQAINRVFLPYIALQGLANAANSYTYYPSHLSEVITAGEQLKVNESIRNFFSGLSDCTFFNQYGPTESHVVTQFQLQGSPSSWDEMPSIGLPIQNTRVDLVNESGQVISAPGEMGELYLSGSCLADGYLNRKELTEERFSQFSGKTGASYRVYKTGDLGYYGSNGELFFVGRKDDQVKINGFRVELGEVELAAFKITGVDECAVVTDKYQDGQLYLNLFYTSTGQIGSDVLRRHLGKVLPEYMVPAKITLLEKIPKTTSGKVDRKRLSTSKDSSLLVNKKAELPQNGLEAGLAKIWGGILPEVEIAGHSNFFDLGGSSILAQKLSLQIREKLNVQFPVAQIYQYPTIKGQAAFLSKDEMTSFQTAGLDAHPEQKKVKDIAIIAFSGRFPGANSASEFWEMVREGREGISFFSNEELDPLLRDLADDPDYIKARGIVQDVDKFDYDFFGMNPKTASIMDPQQRLFMEICYETLEKAGWIASRPGYKVGVFAGTNNNTYYTKNLLFDHKLAEIFGAIQVMSLNEKDYVATRTAYQFNLKGPAVSVHSACSTSLLAVAQAVESIRSGQCAAALAGGSSVTFPVWSGQRHEEGSVFSKDGHCRPFDTDASGTMFSDGAGVVLLKDLDKAIEDGDEIYAVIKGVGVTNDGSDKASFSSPSIIGQADAVRSALGNANIGPDRIGYIEAHGTATPIGDPIEVEAYKLAFGTSYTRNSCAIGSVKSNIGHLTAASGIAGLIKTIYALKEKTLPASLGYEQPNPQIDFENSPFYVQAQTQPWESDRKRVAGVSSYGIGGTNVHVVMEEFVSPTPGKSAPEAGNNLVAYAAKSAKSLEEYAAKLLGFIGLNAHVGLGDFSVNLRKRYFNHGLSHVFSFTDLDELKEKLKQAAGGDMPVISSKGEFNFPVFLFPGQGSQYIGMGQSLLATNEVYREAFERCCNEFNKYLLVPLQSVVLGESDVSISDTKFTQPALFTLSYALSKTLMAMGVWPSAFCGHSIGEYIAAHLAGVFSFEDAVRIVALRGKLISELPTGNMLSIKAHVDVVNELLPDNLSMAVVNSPGLCVVSGEADAIIAFKETVDNHSIPCQIIPTSHAFHSHMMDGVLADFAAAVGSVERHIPQIPIMSTQSGRWLTDSEAQSEEYWITQIRNEVRFSDAFTALTEELPQAYFIEVGPGNVLTGFAHQHSFGKNFPIAHTLNRKSSTGELEYLMGQLGSLAAKGAQINLVSSHTAYKRLDLPTYAFDKKLCWFQEGSVANPEFARKNDNIIEPAEAEPATVPTSEPYIMQSTNHHSFVKLQRMLEDASGTEISENEIDSTFFELGLDSLVLTQLAFSIKKEFGVQLSFRQLNDSHNTPKAVLDCLDQQVPAAQASTAVQVNPSSVNLTEEIQLLQKQLEAVAQQFANLQKPGPATSALARPDQISMKPGNDEGLEESKKPFGAIARIERKPDELSPTALRFLRSFEKEYTGKTGSSKSYAQEYRQVMADPRVVTGFKPAIKELVYPIVTSRSRGSRLTDIDGNEYLDWLNGFGSNMFGYSPDFIVEAIKEQLDKGYEIGPQHILAGEVAELICKLTKNERAAFCNTGSEAVLGAMRIARTVSSRPLIVSFTGSYHGVVDEALVRATKSGKTFPAAPGILSENVQQVIVLEYGSGEALRIIQERAHEIAGVLVEPVQSRRPEFVPVTFLKELRKLTASLDICLIFDEVITGFRAFPGGVQEGFGITADLATYGKVVGGGMPIGVIGGKSKWMDALDGGYWQYGDGSVPPAGVTYFAGTFVRHPLALAAAKASLMELDRKGPAFQDGLSSLASTLVTGMNEIFRKYNVAYYAVNYRSLWKIKTKNEFPYWELLFTMLRNEGIHIWENFPCFVTAAHVENDIGHTIQLLEKVLISLIEHELVEGDLPNRDTTFMDIHNPPFAGAKIGLDEDGNPCWIKDSPYCK